MRSTLLPKPVGTANDQLYWHANTITGLLDQQVSAAGRYFGRVETLPVSGDVQDMDTVDYLVDKTNGVTWRLLYRAAETTYKWHYVGGPPLYSEVAAEETTGSASYVALTTAGPSVTLPVGGDYDVETGCRSFCSADAATLFMSYDIGG